jgi:secondary thiamine-phosphate synthase enzyme
MSVINRRISLASRGNADVLDITIEVSNIVHETELENGMVTIFCPSATSGLTTIEYESGCVSDLKRMLDEIIDPNRHYAHNARWGDGNGHSHVRAALIGPSLTVPFIDNRLMLGTWQQIIFMDFDNRPRNRNLIVQVIGE